MKFLENYELNKFNARLEDGIESTTYILFGKLELYSCKKAKTDKLLSRELKEKIKSEGTIDHNKMFEEQIKKSLAPIRHNAPVLSPTSAYSTSPSFGPLEPNSSTIIELISTLNHVWPDYDFKSTDSKDFSKILKSDVVMNSINLALREVCESDERVRLWSNMDTEMDLKNCNIYEYQPDEKSDPQSRHGRIWCWNYIFYNKKMKKILFFCCNARSREYVKYSAGCTSDVDSDPESFYSNPKNQSVHYYPRGSVEEEDVMEMSEF